MNKMQNDLAQHTTNCCHETLYQTAICYHHPNKWPQTPGQGKPRCVHKFATTDGKTPHLDFAGPLPQYKDN